MQVADFLTRVKEARWALVAGVVGRKLVIVFRCDGHQKHAGRTAQEAFGAAGSSGGHADMARAEIEAENLPPEAVLTNNESMEKYILGRLCGAEKEFRPLLRAINAYYSDK